MNKIEKTLSFLIALIFCIECEQKKDSLELINQSLISGSVNESEVVKVLDEYLINLEIPDSVKIRVDSLAKISLLDYYLDQNFLIKPIAADSNPYELEYELKKLTKSIIQAKANSDSANVNRYLKIAAIWASFIDTKLDIQYWEPWLAKIWQFDSVQAGIWLRAEVAHGLCRKYQDDLSARELAESYGAYGLQCLKYAEDIRLELDIKQRLQVFLFYYNPYHRLSISWANKNHDQAMKIGYYLRANGFNYHKAEALHGIGENDQAIRTFYMVLKSAMDHKDIPYMNWFDVNSQIYLGYCYIDNGQLTEALQVYESMQNYQLGSVQRIQLHIMSGLIFRITGQYEKAEANYNLAIDLIESNQDHYNQIVIFNNLGYLYYQLTEYRKALIFLGKGRHVIEQYQKHNTEYKSRILLTEAGIYIALNKSDSADYKLSQANAAIENIGSFPVLQSELLIKSAEVYYEMKDYPRALELFQQADTLCHMYGLIKYRLDMMPYKISTLIMLGEYNAAQDESNLLLVKSKETENREVMIEAFAGLAEVAYHTGDISRAVEISEKMLIEIENLSAVYRRTLRLTSFRQKMYQYLKRCVLYEIHNHRVEKAFIKLGYAKARSLFLPGNHERINVFDSEHFLNTDKIQSLKREMNPGSLIIDYFLAEDSLYIFAFNKSGLNLYKRSVNSAVLERNVEDYLATIHSTVSVYKNYDDLKMDLLFRTTLNQGRNLFKILLGDKGLVSALAAASTLYLIKDEFLYQLPFSTIVVDNEFKETFLIEQIAITNVPSNQYLFKTDIKPKTSRKYRKLLLGADLEFSGVGNLVSIISKKYPEYTFIGETNKLDKSKILSYMQDQYDNFIFIGHGKSNAEFPELSELLFKSSEDIANVSPICVTLGDILTIDHLEINLGILLGCETGHGKLYRGSGMMGIQQGLLSLGVENVVGTYWSIEANQSIKYAGYLFKDFDSWANPADWLRSAQLEMISDLKNDPYYKYPHPYFWGGFNHNSLEL